MENHSDMMKGTSTESSAKTRKSTAIDSADAASTYGAIDPAHDTSTNGAFDPAHAASTNGAINPAHDTRTNGAFDPAHDASTNGAFDPVTTPYEKTISLTHRLKHLIRSNRLNVFLFLLLLILALLSLSIGRYPIPLMDLFAVVSKKLNGIAPGSLKTVSHIIFNIRLPRVIAAIITGSCLATSGAALQGTFKNPMVSPGLLGVASGSAFGAALGILLGLSALGTQILSFAAGMLTVFVVYIISTIISRESQSSITLILLGMVTSSLFTSLISLLKYAADPYDTLPAITFWLMGSLSQIDYTNLSQIFLPVAIGLVTLWIVRFQITILSFGEDEATALGVNYKVLRLIVITASTMITASVVSISGLIGFVGLIVPHMARLIVGPNYNKLIPASIALGGIYLLIIDNLSRSLLAAELPLGILTSIIGAPFFVFLLAGKLNR